MQINEIDFTQKVLEGCTVKQLQEIYGVSRNTVYKYKTLWNLIGKTPNNKSEVHPIEGYKICVTCGTEKNLYDFYANGYQPNGKKKYKSSCKICQNKKDYIRKYNKINSILVTMGLEYRCSNCGYDKNTAALCFHHLNPDAKDFQISQLSEYTIEELELEINKCIVLCHNCHMEEHYPHLNKIVVDA